MLLLEGSVLAMQWGFTQEDKEQIPFDGLMDVLELLLSGSKGITKASSSHDCSVSTHRAQDAIGNLMAPRAAAHLPWELAPNQDPGGPRGIGHFHQVSAGTGMLLAFCLSSFFKAHYSRTYSLLSSFFFFPSSCCHGNLDIFWSRLWPQEHPSTSDTPTGQAEPWGHPCRQEFCSRQNSSPLVLLPAPSAWGCPRL